MSSMGIKQLIEDVQAAFDRRPTEIESGLDVEDAALLQLRKACRLLASGEALRDAKYHTLHRSLVRRYRTNSRIPAA